MLQQTTELGLTFGQILSLLAFLAAIVGIWIKQSNDTTELRARVTSIEKNQDRTELNIKEFVAENKLDHEKVITKIEDTNKEIMTFLQGVKLANASRKVNS